MNYDSSQISNSEIVLVGKSQIGNEGGEKFWDDEEQMKYLKEKEKKHKNKKQLSTNNAKKVEK